MKLIKCIFRPHKLEEVIDALTRLSVTGMAVTEVRGHGRQQDPKAVYRGTEYTTLRPKFMLDCVVHDEIVDVVVSTVIQTARTGEIGDGRVFVIPVDESYHVRTGWLDR